MNLNKTSDYVTYEISEDTNLYSNKNCYSFIMNKWDKNVFTCLPNLTPSLMPFDMFERWMNLCKKNGLLIEEAILVREKQSNIMVLDGKHTSRHEILASLCCYRWADSLGEMVKEILDLTDKKPQLNFYQILHKGLSGHITNWNHSISLLMKQHVYSKNMADLIHSLAPCFAFMKKNGAAPIIRGSGSGSFTISAIYESINGLPDYMDLAYGRSNTPYRALECDCLDEKYSILYEKQASYPELFEMYEKLS